MSSASTTPNPASTRGRRRRFSIAHLALALPWVALVIDAWKPITDNSFLWHVRAGTVQSEQIEVLTKDPFSFTAGGERWLTQSWLVELLYGWMEGLSGLGFVPYMLLVVGLLIFAGIGLLAYRRSGSVTATAFVMVLATLALISFLVPRPVLFSYLLMVLVMVAWDRPQTHWALPFLFWIWASVHGSFVIGLAYVGLSILMDRRWKMLLTAVVCGLATWLTAHGLGVVDFLAEFTQNREALGYITEWRRPELAEVVFLPVVGAIAFIVIGAYRRLIEPRHLWLVVPFTLLALTSVRAIPPAWLALVPVVATALTRIGIGSRAGLQRRLAMVFLAVVLVLPFLLIEPAVLSSDRFPVEASAHLTDARTFHDDVTGGYLIWAEGPERRVYVDDRAELYGARLGEFVAVRSGKEPWEPVFEGDGIAQALVGVDDEIRTELSDAGWQTVFADENYVVLRP